MKRIGIAAVVLAALVTPVLSAEQGSLGRGKELFNSTQLGTNQKSCATCHPNGRGLKEVSSNEKQLVKVVNQCIEKALAGKPLPSNSSDMVSILMYLRTFATD